MKKVICVIVLVCATVLNGYAQSDDQKNIVSVSPFRIWNGLRVKYERVHNEKLTYGAITTLYYASYPGVQVAPIARFYFKKNAPEGFYAQAKVVAGFFKHDYSYGEWEEQTQSFTSFGAGVAAGYQLFWGKNERWSIDANLGLKFVSSMPTPEEYVTGGVVGAFDKGIWATTGPGSIFDGLISIGYRF